jgi:hypothetical protein
VVFFASHVVDRTHQGHDNPDVEAFFSPDGADKRFKEAQLQTSLMDPEIFPYLIGAETICYQRLEPDYGRLGTDHSILSDSDDHDDDDSYMPV